MLCYNQFVLFFVLVLGLLVGQSVGTIELQDLSDVNFNSRYGTYDGADPTKVNCFKIFTYLITDPQATSEITLLSVSANIIPKPLFRNFTTLLLQVDFSLSNQESNNFLFTVGSGSSQPYLFNSPCIGAPTTFEIELYNQTYPRTRYYLEPKTDTTFDFTFKVKSFTNPQYSPNLEIISNNTCYYPYVTQSAPNIYTLSLVYTCRLSDIDPNDNILISVGVFNANSLTNTFVLNSYLKASKTPMASIGLNSVQLYPRRLDNSSFYDQLHCYNIVYNYGFDLPILSQLFNGEELISGALVMKSESTFVFYHPSLQVSLGPNQFQLSAYAGSNSPVNDSISFSYFGPTNRPIAGFINPLLESEFDILSFAIDSDCTWQCDNLLFSFDTGGYNLISGFWPYGATRGHTLSKNYTVDMFISPYIAKKVFVGLAGATLISKDLNTETPDTVAPLVTSLKIISIPNSPFDIVRMIITDDISGFSKLLGLGDYRNLVQGSILNGEYDFLVQTNQFSPFSTTTQYLYDFAFNPKEHTLKNYVNLDLENGFRKCLNSSLVTAIMFEFNDIDVSNSSFDNRLLIYTTQPASVDIKPSIFIPSLSSQMFVTDNWIGGWNPEKGCYAIPFTVKQHYPSPIFSFYTFFDDGYRSDGTNLKIIYGNDAELRIKSSLGDAIGPFVSKIDYPSGRLVTVQSQVDTNIQWNITVQDPINGVKKGLFTIASTLDNAQYNYTFTSWGEKTKVIPIDLKVNGKCKSQTFYIQYVYLQDQQGYETYYFQSGPSNMGPNSLIQVLTENTIYAGSINITCLHPQTDNTPPTLSSFKFTPNFLDVMFLGKDLVKANIVNFAFETSDESGILIDSLPIVYLQDQSTVLLFSQKAKLVQSNDTWASYICEFEIPFGFGYPYGIKASIYGIIDNQSNFNGYSPSLLKQNGFPNTINVYQPLTTNLTIIETKDLDRNGNGFILYGRQVESSFLVMDFLNGSTKALIPSFKTSSVLYFDAVGLINVPLLHLTLWSTLNTEHSNTLLVSIEQPIPKPLQPDESSNSNSGSSTELPTNSPIPCLNNCGGPDHGTCTPSGCICKSPWVDLSCSSQVIIIDPIINSTTPSTTIIVPSNDKDTAIYYSIISIVSLNELDKDNKIINTFSFPKWIASNNTISKYNQYTNSSYLYTTSLTNNNITTNINVSIDYFNQPNPVNITFANQIFSMNPYSLKYSINISEYSFTSSLNTLQLVMLASIEDQKENDDQCSSNQFGDTAEPNSEYIKMQVNDHSLYGRFIKRGIVDGRVKSVSNEPLDSQLQGIKSKSKLQSYIGINIPYFHKLVQLDPDFSILVNNQPAGQDSDNAICAKNKSKLTGAQIAGIVIGCVAFVAIIVISVTYAILKTKKQKLFNKNVELKLKDLNK